MGKEAENRIYTEKARDGITVLLAGAGSGKTHTLISRAVSCVDTMHCRPEQVLILAFNRSAAVEIRERLLSQKGFSSLPVYTFHAFAFLLLKKYSASFLQSSGFSNFPSVTDEDEISEMVSNAVNNSSDSFRGLPHPVICDLVMRYESLPEEIIKKMQVTEIFESISVMNKKLKNYRIQKGLITFDEIIDSAIRLLEEHRDIREEVRKAYKYILVDEFQDLSESNFVLLRNLFNENKGSLFAVGDDWQSIYGFRGAKIDYILKPARFLSRPEIIRFRHNYRSRKEIVSVSESFIKRNKKRTARSIIAVRGKGGTVTHCVCRSFDEEFLVISEIISSKSSTSESIAVLYRNNWQGGMIKKHLAGQSGKSVSFLTFHKSKGLEFDTVIIAGVNDRIIPDRMSDIEEERRLFYVAMTRARDNLMFILHEDEKGRMCRFGRELGF